MICVDTRAGSKELIAPLRKAGMEVVDTQLEFGDLAFEGRGEQGAPVQIGIEFKKLGELVTALRTERLQGYQMRGMRGDTETPGPYDYSYLFVEGELLYDKQGGLMERKKFYQTPIPGQMSVSELLKRLYVLHLCGGLNPWWTLTRPDTIQAILALYHTWTDEDLDRHKSHLAIYEAPTLIAISDFRRTVKTFPHIGLRASLAVEIQFGGSLRNAVCASVDDWAQILIPTDKGTTRRLGTRYAEDIVRFCIGGH